MTTTLVTPVRAPVSVNRRYLAAGTFILLGLILNTAAGWWWADPAAGYVLVYYAAREVREIFFAGSA